MKKYALFLIFTLLIMIGGCTNIHGGENDMKNAKAILSFSSFDGGGPEYSIVLDSDIVSYNRTKKYAKANHKKLNGAGFTITYTFKGVTPGETEMTVEERSPLGADRDHKYSVKVDDKLKVTIETLEVTEL
ncbi:MAG: hypothetical protein J6X60_08090 [Ruminiclostridium sp.]|nr:hypothetical protein [Ruminiclostridium sp.]